MFRLLKRIYYQWMAYQIRTIKLCSVKETTRSVQYYLIVRTIEFARLIQTILTHT